MGEFSMLGFTCIDSFVCLLCITASVFGSGVDYLLRRDDWEKYPSAEPTSLPIGRNIALFGGRVLTLGMASGLATWLMFYGSMSNSPSSYCKLLLLAGWAGFSAPDIAIRLRKRKFSTSSPFG